MSLLCSRWFGTKGNSLTYHCHVRKLLCNVESRPVSWLHSTGGACGVETGGGGGGGEEVAKCTAWDL